MASVLKNDSMAHGFSWFWPNLLCITLFGVIMFCIGRETGQEMDFMDSSWIGVGVLIAICSTPLMMTVVAIQVMEKRTK